MSGAAWEAALGAALERIREAEAIDAKHGFRLPGDSALYITLWAMECELGEAQRAREAGAVPHPGYCHRLPECFGRASCPRDTSCID